MIVAQNNRYGTIAKVEGKLMEFATEEEAREYQQRETFSEILQREVRRLEVEHGRRIPIH